MIKGAVPLLVAALLSCLPCPAYAWFDFGHMAVAYIAYQRLEPAKKERVKVLLKLNPCYEKWQKQVSTNVSENDRDGQIFMLAATWPDLIKKDPKYISDGTNRGHRPDGPFAAQNVGYSDYNMHKYWHFVDEPFSSDGTPLAPVLVPNARTQIAAFRAVLSSDSSDELKSYDLVWLLHIIGDVHQPLHCTTRISRSELEGDNGGNNVKLESYENLHAFWDGAPGDGKIDEVPDFARRLAKANSSLALKSDAADWIAESFHYARTKVYVSPVKKGNGPFDLSKKYRR